MMPRRGDILTDGQKDTILRLARHRAAAEAKRPAIKEKIMRGLWDDKASVLRAKRVFEREVILAMGDGIRPLLDEEDEPCFGPLIDRAKARAAQLAGTPDGELIAGLVAAYEHAEAEAEMIYWNASALLYLRYPEKIGRGK